jgi:hypothetical protein
MAPKESANQKRDYKSSLFVNMFGRNVNAKEHFLSLYNAIHDTNFKIGEVEIKPVTLENVVYNNIENDVSMEINDSIVVLAEHQSTININKDVKHPILQKCEPLLAYSNFTEYARIGKRNGERNPPKYALEKCRQGNLLTEYFNNLSKEEQSMIFGEWDQEKFIEVQKKIAAEDRSIANAKNALRMGLSLEQAAKITDLPLEQVYALKEELERENILA